MSVAAGRAGERRAEKFLEQQGYKVLKRNYACRLGEIDLVCEEVGAIVFVEVRVRGRSRYGHPEETISQEKRRRIVLTARQFLVDHKIEERECRFDIVTILGDEPPRLERNAFGTNW